MSNKINVSIRVRPLLDWELKKQTQTSKLKVDPTNNQIRISTYEKEAEKCFEFDCVSDGSTSQQEFYHQVDIDSYVKRVVEGFHTSIFAYGQTGSGKTFTMDGYQYQSAKPVDNKIVRHKRGNTDDTGIIPRAIYSLFREIEQASKSSNRTFSVFCSMLEIYNERIFDLLNPEQVNKLDNLVTGLRLRWNKTDQFIVENLFTYETQTAEEAISFFRSGIRNKVIAMHKLNSSSSRSHCIFELKVESYNNAHPSDILSSKLVFVDLAGSERIGLTGTEGRLAKESIDINKSLFTLRQVIMTIAEGEGKRDVHIPYRESKLTSLLKQSFGGNSYCLMIACLSPSDENVEENLSTLNYASKARRIENKPTKNDDPKLRDITELKIKNHTLLQELLKANDHIAFLSRLTNNSVKKFGGAYAEEAQNNLEKERKTTPDDSSQRKTQASDESQKTQQDHFPLPTIDPVRTATNSSKKDRYSRGDDTIDDQSTIPQQADGYLPYLSDDFKEMSESEKKLPEYLSKELVHSIHQIRDLLMSLNRERERNEALSIKNEELEGINARLMEENRELRDKIEALELLNSSKEKLHRLPGKPNSQEKSSALDEIMRLKRERHFLEKRIKDLEEPNVSMSLDFQGSRNGISTPDSQTSNPIHFSTLSSMKNDDTESHFRTTTNYARNSMYRKFIRPIDMRNQQYTAEPSREMGPEELTSIEMPRTSGQKRDFSAGLKPIYELNNSYVEAQTEMSEFQKKDRVSRSINLPRGGFNKIAQQKAPQKKDFLTLNDVFAHKIFPQTKANQVSASQEGKLLNAIRQRPPVLKDKNLNNSFF